uniref:Secreted protein n=1 Tax=Macrostomum lignano TaxID=282301 RepID=A0A1I8FDQ4_9PLAT
TTGSSGGRSQDCLLPAASAAVTTAQATIEDCCCLPLAAVTTGSSGGRSLLRVLSSTSVEMRQSNVHYAAADAQNAECTQDPRRRISERRRQ